MRQVKVGVQYQARLMKSEELGQLSFVCPSRSILPLSLPLSLLWAADLNGRQQVVELQWFSPGE